MQTLPPGHFACPRCRNPVLAGAPVCPNCGAAFRPGAPRRQPTGGIVVIFVGLFLTLAGGAGFLYGCVTMWSNIGVSSGASKFEPIFQASIWAGGAGLVLMFFGLIVTIVQMIRKGS